ncbi:hypothetical protein [Clostridium felsineum]|uniref:Uncharacterized protein n=1 Tax=Clostridium felsineum TaxID=36839 RepID=A0A1S8KZT9_9CLOT|nr:hypothetical protein [Clostridium felsineum]URZ06459.1 hypothetical protein CLROS_017920 [Clostridium felsineum]URZ11494.1 hypothetical protein CROST_022110 [Clostridium felsineum]
MTPGEIIEKIKAAQIALTKGNSEIKTLGIKKAETERNYKIALNKKVLVLKTEKYPATLIQDLSRGDEKVAQLRMNRDIAESAYYTAISASDNIRLEIETLRSMLTWLRVELKNT